MDSEAYDRVRRKNPHEELVKPENRRVNATLTETAIRKVSLYETKRRFIQSIVQAVREKNADKRQDLLMHPSEGLIETFLELSPAKDGEHRKDLVDAMKAPAGVTTGLSLVAPAAPAQPASKKSNL